MKRKIDFVSVVIPCFNEEKNIPQVYKRVKDALIKSVRKYEIIFVDNGSTDRSGDVLNNLVKRESFVTVISYSRNFGPHGAYSGGLEYTKVGPVICIDGDLQDPPELIPKFIQKWKEGYDVVYGIRKKRKESFLRTFLIDLYYKALNKLSYIKIPLHAGDFGLMDRKVVDLINSLPEHNKYFTGLRAWVGFKQVGVEYERRQRVSGNTNFSLLEYFRLAFQSITSFSYKPLELISLLAILVVLLIIVGIFIYFLDFFFYPNNPRGFITLILVILFLGGIQLLCLSIIGQYLASIFEEVKNRPRYIIKEVIRGKTPKNDRKIS